MSSASRCASCRDDAPVVLATGGFQGDRELVRRHVTPEADHLLLRANRWSTGDGLSLGSRPGAATSAGMAEFYGRNMPAPPARVTESEFVPLAQLYARHATVFAGDETFTTRTWSEVDAVQWTARQPGARAWYRVANERLSERVRDRTVADWSPRRRRRARRSSGTEDYVTVPVRAGITTTVGGLAVDCPLSSVDGVFAAGADAGGVMARRILLRPGRGTRAGTDRGRGGALVTAVSEPSSPSASRKSSTWWMPKRTS